MFMPTHTRIYIYHIIKIRFFHDKHLHTSTLNKKMVDVLLSLGMFEVASSPCCGVWGSHQAGAIVVAGLISPYAADRDYAREVAAAAAAVCEEGKG